MGEKRTPYGQSIVLVHVGITIPLPDGRPGGTGIGRAVDLGIGPPQVQAGHHDGTGVLHVNTQATKAIGEVAARNGSDVLPGAAGDVVAVNGTGSAIVGTGTVAVGKVEGLLSGLELALVREVRAGLASDGRPSGTGVVGNPDGRRAVSGGTNKDAGRGAVGGSRSRVKGNKSNALLVVVEASGIGWVYDIVADSGERRHLGEGDTTVCALVEAMAAASTEVDDVGVLGIDSKSLAHAATGHVSSNLEGQLGARPCSTSVGTADKGTIVGVPSGVWLAHIEGNEALFQDLRVGVHAGSGIDLVGILRIESNSIDTPVVPDDCMVSVRVTRGVDDG